MPYLHWLTVADWFKWGCCVVLVREERWKEELDYFFIWLWVLGKEWRWLSDSSHQPAGCKVLSMRLPNSMSVQTELHGRPEVTVNSLSCQWKFRCWSLLEARSQISWSVVAWVIPFLWHQGSWRNYQSRKARVVTALQVRFWYAAVFVCLQSCLLYAVWNLEFRWCKVAGFNFSKVLLLFKIQSKYVSSLVSFSWVCWGLNGTLLPSSRGIHIKQHSFSYRIV